MKIAVIYGSERKGSTYHVVQLFLERLRSETDGLTEFFLPRDMPHFCAGCAACFANGEAFCPHHKAVAPIQEAMRSADLLIFATPTYVLRASGQMKAMLDHLAFQFMIHRPAEEMFRKTALIVTTGAGGGMNDAIKEIKASLDMWGVGRVFSYGKAVFATNWDGVSQPNKTIIEQNAGRIAAKILAGARPVKPRLKVKLLFHVFRLMHKRTTINAPDHAYWEKKGWLGSARPW